MIYAERLKQIQGELSECSHEDHYKLEGFATFLLSAMDIEPENKTKYNIFSDDKMFRRALNEKPTYDETLDFLKINNFSRAYIISKNLFITNRDRQYGCIKQYQDLINKTNKVSLKRELIADQLIVKQAYRHTIYFKHVCSGSEDIHWDLFNFTDPQHVKALLKYNSQGQNLDNWIHCILYDLNQLLSNVKLNKNQQKVLKLWRIEEFTETEIGDVMGISQQAVCQHLGKIVNKIIIEYTKNYGDWVYTYKVKGNYKICKRCKQAKLTAEFSPKSTAKDGLHPYCKSCR